MSATTHYVIREATPADAEEIIHMHSQAWLDTYPNEGAGVSREWVAKRIADWSSKERLKSRRERIREAKESPDMFYDVAVNSDGKIIGLACPMRDKESQRVGGLYVAKEYYGSGLGQQLMDRIVAWADPTRPLELEVAAYNSRAIRFYEKYGFEKVPGSEAKHAETIPTVMMIRKGDNQ